MIVFLGSYKFDIFSFNIDDIEARWSYGKLLKEPVDIASTIICNSKVSCRFFINLFQVNEF